VRLLDLFCGAGGAAMGYHRAGFEVVGVDIKPQPHYPFEFHQGDATTWPLDGFDAIHASPPCQGYSRMRHLPWLAGKEYPMLLATTWSRLEASGVPWVIENVEDAPMPYSVVLCGWTLGLPLYRHRRFGASFLMWQLPHRRHEHVIAHGRRNVSQRRQAGSGTMGVLPSRTQKAGLPVSIQGHSGPPVQVAREAMGIDWMTRDELTQAIPPAYTQWIGERLAEHIASEPVAGLATADPLGTDTLRAGSFSPGASVVPE